MTVLNQGRKFYAMIVAQATWVYLLTHGIQLTDSYTPYLSQEVFYSLSLMTVGGYFVVNGVTKWKPQDN